MFNVLFAADNNFAPYLGVSVYSLLKNNHKDFDKINIYVLDKDISENNKIKILDIVNNYEFANLFFIKDEGINKILGAKVQANRALSSYSRLFTASLIDETIDKILYLDGDSIILGSFKELWEMDMQDYSCAGVLDVGPDYVKTAVGLNSDDIYINAGVLLINLKKWRDENTEDKFVDFIIKNNYNVYNNDQGILNAVLSDEILTIDPKFNLMSPFLERKYEDVIKWNGLHDYYDKKTIEDALKSPRFLHFVHFINGRPWFKETNHPCKELYLKYANETSFKNEVLVKDYRGLKYTFFFSLTKFLPFKLVCWIYKPYRSFFIKYF